MATIGCPLLDVPTEPVHLLMCSFRYGFGHFLHRKIAHGARPKRCQACRLHMGLQGYTIVSMLSYTNHPQVALARGSVEQRRHAEAHKYIAVLWYIDVYMCVLITCAYLA